MAEIGVSQTYLLLLALVTVKSIKKILPIQIAGSMLVTEVIKTPAKTQHLGILVLSVIASIEIQNIRNCISSEFAFKIHY